MLPEQIRTIMEKYLNTQDEGIEGENAGVFSENLVRTLNQKLNIPLLGEEEGLPFSDSSPIS